MATPRAHVSTDVRARIDIDTLYHILSHLTPEPEDTKGSRYDSKSALKALARLARVHSSFTQPVLAVLWRSLPSQTPLERLLRAVRIAQGPRRALEMCGTPSTHGPGWKRFQEHAALVREIIVYPFVRGVVAEPQTELLEDTFWCEVSAAFGRTPILPHLQRATLRSMDSDGDMPIDMGVLRLLNPSGRDLHELGVTLPSMHGEGSERLTRALAGSFSSIETLRIFVPVLDPQGATLESLLASHPHLRTLELHPHGASINMDHLSTLATALTRLESLTFPLHSWQPPKHYITFKELRSLKVSLYTLTLGALGLLLAHVEAPNLRSFTISESHRDSSIISKELPNHLHTLLVKFPSLTAFEWDSRQYWGGRKMGYIGERRADAPLAELVAPLLSHRAMRSFVVRFDGPLVACTPADFRALAEAWPDLETFCLRLESDSVGNGIEQRADVESVVAFARLCPRLRSLDIPRVVQYDSTPPLTRCTSRLLLGRTC